MNFYFSECVCDDDHFHFGITKGIDWYPVKGGMQDFNYLFSNCMEITIELLCGKRFHEARISKEWNNNKEALLRYIELAYTAVRGIVRDNDGQPVGKATVRVDWIGKHIVTTDRGEYWRLLPPGRYAIKAVSEDEMYESEVKRLVINSTVNVGAFLHLDFLLDNPRDDDKDDEPDGFQFKVEETVFRNPIKNITIPRVCLTLSLENGFEWC